MTGIVNTIPYTGYGIDASGYVTGLKGLKFPELWLGTSGAEVQLTADIATLNAVGAGTARLVAATAATLTLTKALHAGKTIVQNAVTGCAIALPAATGTGDVYRVIVKVTITSVGVVISCTPLTDVLVGMAWVMSDNSQAVLAYLPAATDNTITLNGTTTGGYLGHIVELRDIAAGIWEVQSFGKATGTEATPFSHV